MKTTNHFLDQVKKSHGLTSDYQLAKHLGITQAAVTRYRKKQSTMDNYIALKVAETLSVDPMEIIATANMERTKDQVERDAWKTVLSKLHQRTTEDYILCKPAARPAHFWQRDRRNVKESAPCGQKPRRSTQQLPRTFTRCARRRASDWLKPLGIAA